MCIRDSANVANEESSLIFVFVITFLIVAFIICPPLILRNVIINYLKEIENVTKCILYVIFPQKINKILSHANTIYRPSFKNKRVKS